MSGKRRPTSSARFRLESLDHVSPELRAAALTPLQVFNRDANPTWYTARDLPANAPSPLNLLTFATGGQVVAGLFGETQFSWLKVHLLAVHVDYRQQGLGTRLMEEAERLGIARGCRYAYVDTMEYQAPKFYERLGYALAGRLPNWDSQGHAKHFYIKQLATLSASPSSSP